MSKHKKKKHKSNTVQTMSNQQMAGSTVPSGFLVTTAREYHYRYAEEIAYMIEFHKHLSVLMPAKIGLYPLALNLYDGLDFRCREYIIVESQEDIEVFNDLLISRNDENKCIYPILYDIFIERRPVGGCYVLFDLSKEKRLELNNSFITNTDAIIISIGKLEKSDTEAKSSMVRQAQDAMSELFQITMENGKPHCMIFPVESILDVRDIMYANESEKIRLVSELNSVCSDYELNYGIADPITSASGSAEKITQYERMLAEKDLEISILKSVAASAGANMSGLENGISRVMQIKRDYSDKFDRTADPIEQEKLETMFQNEVTYLLVETTSNMMTISNRDKYENLLIDQLGADIWQKRLSANSRTYLISAMMTFDSLNKLPIREELDYSGVCLQITKVLDQEMAVRFYIKYKQYLSEKYVLADWPKAMKSKEGYEPLQPWEFTIGSISRVIGANGKGIICDSTAFNMVRGFAKTNLYRDGMTDQEIRNQLLNCAVCAEKTRNDYRNPAAHRKTIPYVSARACIDYLIEQTKMLKLILQDMIEN